MQSSEIHFEYIQDKNLILGHASGLLDFYDFNLHLQELSQHVELSSGPDGLYDFTQITDIRGSLISWEQIAHQICALEPTRKDIKIAIVVGDNQKVIRVFEGWLVITALSEYQYRLFTKMEEAKAWLKLDISAQA